MKHPTAAELLGTWKLQSYTTEYQDCGEKALTLGPHPRGRLSYTPDGRMFALIIGIGSYSGTYTLHGDNVRHLVDLAWDETWIGETLVRQFSVVGDVLRIQAQVTENGRPATAVLIWERA